jgi:uncharacterized protein
MNEVTIMKPDEDYLKKRGVRTWPLWEKEISDFPWKYEATEECFILDGEVDVVSGSATYKIKPGDFVTFAKGLSCLWIIHKPVRKHYNFL